MSEISSIGNSSGSMITKAELKQLSKTQVLEMFDEASHNVFDLAKKYHNEGYDVTLQCFQQNTSTSGNSKENTTYHHERNLLHYACQHKNYDIIKFLIELGVDVNNTDLLGNKTLLQYVKSPFPESTPISEQIEMDRLVLNLLRKIVHFTDESVNDFNFIFTYLQTKSINHQISTVSLLITILQDHRETMGDDNYGRMFRKALFTAAIRHRGKDVILLLLPHCNFQHITGFSQRLFPLIYVADKLFPVSEVSSGKLTHGMRVVIMDGEVEHSILTTDDNLQPKHIEVIIKQFEARKSYLLTHTLTLSKTQQTRMSTAAKKGDFSVALEFDKEGYDIITYSKLNYNVGFNMLLYACFHNRLDLMQEFIDKGVFLYFFQTRKSVLSEYITHTIKFNPKVATFLIDNGIDIHYTNPILEYYQRRDYIPLPDDIAVYFKQQGISIPQSDLETIIKSIFLPDIYNINTLHILKEPFLLQLRDLGADLNSVDLDACFIKPLLTNHFHIKNHDAFKTNVDYLIRLGINFDPDSPTDDSHSSIVDVPFLIRYIIIFEFTFKHIIFETIDDHINDLNIMHSDIQYLVSRGFNVNGVFDGKNVLYYCFCVLTGMVYSNHSAITFNIAKSILKTLVDSNADINYLQPNEMDLLKYYVTTVEDFNPHIASMLIELGVNITDPLLYYARIIYSKNIKFNPDYIGFLVDVKVNITKSILDYISAVNLIKLDKLKTLKVNNYPTLICTIPGIFHKLQLSIDYSMMYSYEDYLHFAIYGCQEIDQYSKFQNETLIYYYRLIMQFITGTTNKQHQVRRLKKHLVRHNRSLNPVSSITSVRSCVSEDYSVVKMLHERYYNTALVLHPVDHTSVLMYAAKHGLIPMVKWVIRLGANVNAVDRKGMTALMYCCKYSQKYEVIELLLWHGADVGVEWKNRYTAFDMLYRMV